MPRPAVFLATCIPPTPEALRRGPSQRRAAQSAPAGVGASVSMCSSRSSSRQRTHSPTASLRSSATADSRTPLPSPTHSTATSRTSTPQPPPTVGLQQLYAAVAHWERVLAGSPELCIERARMVRDLEGVQRTLSPLVGRTGPFQPPQRQLHRLSDPLPVAELRLLQALDSDADDDDDDDSALADDEPEDEMSLAPRGFRHQRVASANGAGGRRPAVQPHHNLRMTLSNSSGELQDDR